MNGTTGNRAPVAGRQGVRPLRLIRSLGTISADPPARAGVRTHLSMVVETAEEERDMADKDNRDGDTGGQADGGRRDKVIALVGPRQPGLITLTLRPNQSAILLPCFGVAPMPTALAFQTFELRS